jgi:8-oxo-dGTP diphosphatase
MATSTAPAGLPVIRAAGGIVLRSTPSGEEVMIVYRKRYQEWTLPKGKLKEGESFQEAAVREVQEETGCSCHLGSYVGTISYARQGVPKVVMFWRMSVLEEESPADPEEIARAVWLPVSAALQRLTHAQERSLLARLSATARPAPGSSERTASFARPAVEAPTQRQETQNETAEATKAESGVALLPAPTASAGSPARSSRDGGEPAGLPARDEVVPPVSQARAPSARDVAEAPRAVTLPWQPAPAPKIETPLLPAPLVPSGALKGDDAQLARDVAAVRIELDYLVRRAEQQDASSAPSWSIATLQHIVNAEQALAMADVEGARRDLHRAQRYAVLGLNQEELATRAQILRDEAAGNSSWRALAIQKLLTLSDDQLTAARLAEAMGLRDEDDVHEKHTDHRILHHIQGLVLMCIIGAALTLSLLVAGLLRGIAPAVFAAMMGAALSAVYVLSRRKRGASVPNPYSTLLTVALGAAAGMAANPICNYFTAIFNLKLQPAWLPLATALVLGYAAQRFLVRFTVESSAPSIR